jgi:hypothetical protein
MKKGALNIFIIYCFCIQYGTAKKATEGDISQYSHKYISTLSFCNCIIYTDVLYWCYNAVHIVVLQTFDIQVRKICRKNKYKNHLRSNNYEVYTAEARCIPSILDVIVLENKKGFSL